MTTSRPAASTRGSVIVTGATGGIGAEVCRALSRKSYTPIVAYRSRRDDANVVAQETHGETVGFDLARPDEIDAAVAFIAGLSGPVIGIAHCASPPPRLAPFGRIADEEMESFWRQNVLGPHRLFAAVVARFLKPQRAGTVVAVTSGGMGHPVDGAMPSLGAYTISKYGLEGILALLAAEHRWLRVAAVRPGFTETRMLEAFDARFIEQFRQHTALKQPSEIAAEIASHFD